LRQLRELQDVNSSLPKAPLLWIFAGVGMDARAGAAGSGLAFGLLASLPLMIPPALRIVGAGLLRSDDRSG
jgi:hypothetical protein